MVVSIRAVRNDPCDRPWTGGKPDPTFQLSDEDFKGLKDFRQVFILPGEKPSGFPVTGS